MLVFDTDAMTVWLDPRHADHERLRERFQLSDSPRPVTTVVSIQEQLSGWLARINAVRKPLGIVDAYKNFLHAFDGYGTFEILPFDSRAQARFDDFRRQKLRVSTLDLRIASIVLVNTATLVTRNLRDFRQVPGLKVEDWSK